MKLIEKLVQVNLYEKYYIKFNLNFFYYNMEMYTTLLDKYGKVHKGKKVVTGKCVFPFKFKGKMYNNCLDTGQGPWCPTKVKKTKTVDTWAYCDLKPKSQSLKNEGDNNASGTNSINSKNKRSVKKKKSIIKSKKIDINKFIKKWKDYVINKQSIILSTEIRIKFSKEILKILTSDSGHKYVKCENLHNILYLLDSSLDPMSKGLQYLGSGTSGAAFKGFLDSDGKLKLSVKLSGINTNYLYNDKHPVNVEVALLKEFNKLIENKISPHHSFFYDSFDCRANIISNIKTLKEVKFFRNLFKDIYRGDKSSNIKIMISELASTDLHNYIQERAMKGNKLSTLEFKVIFLQVCYMLTTTQFYYPGFRHNDLKPDNILVDVYPKEKNTYYCYNIFNKKIYLPDIGARVKLWDLDFASYDSVENSKVNDSWSSDFGCSKDHNSVYDLFIFINLLNRYLKEQLTTEFQKYLEEYLISYDDRLGSYGSQEGIANLGYNKYTRKDSIFTLYGRLTGSKLNPSIKNLIPDDMDSPADILASDYGEDDFFYGFENPPPAKSKVKNINSGINFEQTTVSRTDMFNTVSIGNSP